MKINFLSTSIASAVTIVFLFSVLSPRGCAFNFLPYLLHEGATKSGEGESAFIRIFDFIFGSLIFLAIYKLTNRLTRKRDR